jgi:lysyl-tRNA synthetase class 2
MRKDTLIAKAHLLKSIRSFFESKGFLDVMTPPMVKNPGMETHIHPFQLAHANKKTIIDWYLNTSPEFHMKELLSLGFNDIFTLCYSFRDEPNSTHHRPQFIMLEWYRRNADYEKIMVDCRELFQFSYEYLKQNKIEVDTSLSNIKYESTTVQELFLEFLKIDILEFLDKKDLKELIEKNFKDVPLPVMGEELAWDDYYFLLFLNKIEPHLVHHHFLLIKEFPYHLAALSTLKKEDQRVAERFEIYCKGVELCNCFNELTNLSIQKERFEFQKREKHKLYNYELPEPEVLYTALSNNYPKSAGIALGVERFLKVLTNQEDPFAY